jgi:hypothetical protein
MRETADLNLLHGQGLHHIEVNIMVVTLTYGKLGTIRAKYIHRSEQDVSADNLLTTAENSSMYQIACFQSDSHSVVR